jgi:hypothetical protein
LNTNNNSAFLDKAAIIAGAADGFRLPKEAPSHRACTTPASRRRRDCGSLLVTVGKKA